MTRDEVYCKYFENEKCKRQVSPTQQVQIHKNSSEFYLKAFTFRETRNESVLFQTV